MTLASRRRLGCHAAALWLALGALLVAPTHCGFFGLSEKELVKKLANAKLWPEEVFRAIGKCKANKKELQLNGVSARDLLSLERIRLEDCEYATLQARSKLCNLAETAPNGLKSVANYCRDRVAKLIRLCSGDIEGLAERCLDTVAPRDLDTLRDLYNKLLSRPEANFEAILNEYLAPQDAGAPLEERHSRLGHSCDRMMAAFAPIKTILDRAEEFGVPPTENDIVQGWIQAYRMCEFYQANLKPL